MNASLIKCSLVLWLLAAPFVSIATESLNVADVLAQQREIRAEAEAGEGRYRDMPPERRQELFAKQARLFQLLEGKQLANLTEVERVEAFNTVEWIEATINQAEDQRMVCERERSTGSHRFTTVCKTVAQRRQEREDSRNAVDRRAVCSEGKMCSGQ